jgi:hypothetical protein
VLRGSGAGGGQLVPTVSSVVWMKSQIGNVRELCAEHMHACAWLSRSVTIAHTATSKGAQHRGSARLMIVPLWDVINISRQPYLLAPAYEQVSGCPTTCNWSRAHTKGAEEVVHEDADKAFVLLNRASKHPEHEHVARKMAKVSVIECMCDELPPLSFHDVEGQEAHERGVEEVVSYEDSVVQGEEEEDTVAKLAAAIIAPLVWRRALPAAGGVRWGASLAACSRVRKVSLAGHDARTAPEDPGSNRST